MATIAENLQIIKDSTDAIRQVILEKGGTISGGISTYADSIGNISGGSTSGAVSKSDVNFYDCDGTLLHSYSKDEFLQMSSLPELPTREGLICQGWNYNLSDAKTYVEEYGVLDIGATYITDDGKTRLYISIATDGRMNAPLYFSQTVSDGVEIDWGDGSATQTISGTGNKNTTHTYNEIGDYIITLNPKSGCTLGLGYNSSLNCVMGANDNNNAVYKIMLQRVELGNSVTSIGNYAFNGCYSLSSIVIPNSVTSIGNYAFNVCYSLSSVVIPNSVTSIGNYAFSSCYSLLSVVIPNSVTSIGTYAFSSCYSLLSIVIPNSVTSIGGSSFVACYSLSSVVIPNSVTSIGTYAFSSCYSLLSVVIPNSATSIGTYAFNGCYSLSSIVIPNSVTSIGSSSFYNCYSLSSVVIPNSVTSIGGSSFYNCYGMAYYDFSQHTTIPTLAYTSAFQSIPSDCKIIVPDSLYDSWKAAANWSSHASKIIKKSDWDAQKN